MIHNTDVPCQTVRQLLSKFYRRWGGHCQNLGTVAEPNLIHLEERLHDRIETQNDAYLPSKSAKQNHLPKNGNIPRDYREGSCRKTFITATKIGKQKNQTKLLGDSITKVAQCGPKITDFPSVSKYEELKPSEKFHSMKERKLCYNCFKKNQFTTSCTSKNIIQKKTVN